MEYLADVLLSVVFFRSVLPSLSPYAETQLSSLTQPSKNHHTAKVFGT